MTCDERCSHRQTPETLAALGYEIPVLRPDAPVMEKAEWQSQISKLIYRAWQDGHVRICSRTERIVAHEAALAASAAKSKGKRKFPLKGR